MRPPRPRHVVAAWAIVLGAVYLLLSVQSTGQAAVSVSFCPDCERFLLDTLANASEIRCAFYDLDSDTVEKVLRRKDAEVLVYEENHEGLGRPARSEGLMHHKFCVLDGKKVLTGSTNPTRNGLTRNDNNMILIVSAEVADWYEEELDDLGGQKSARGATVPLQDGSLSVRFCPQQRCEEALLREIGLAREHIRFMTFSFTSDTVGDALLDAHVRGVQVEGVFEARQNPAYSEYPRLNEWGLAVHTDSNPGTMHHKVFIIDNRTVITGSYNPTWSANERNDENLVIIRDEMLARAYIMEYARVMHAARAEG